MFKFEEKSLNFIIKNAGMFLFFIVNILAIIIRVNGKDFISSDMSKFYIVWYNTYSNHGGIKALASSIGDQNLLFQTILSLMSYIKINCVYLLKALSIFLILF
ncbi:hypothetical protein IKE67_08550 [bacterium]|nr:hypothetical protein [bacterium]